MLKSINMTIFIKVVIIITSIVSIIIFSLLQWYLGKDSSIWMLVSITASVSTVLMFCISTEIVSRFLWGLYNYFCNSSYPDLNGVWHGTISLKNRDEIIIDAVIKYSLFTCTIVIDTVNAKSTTIEVFPKVTGGQKQLYYVWKCEPNDSTYPEYRGVTIFNIDESIPNEVVLSGKFFTSRQTNGKTELKRIS